MNVAVDHKQTAGRDRDIILEALNSYREWLLDDCYDADTCLARIVGRMKERIDIADGAPNRADLCTPTDERVALKWTAYGDACWIAPAPLFGSFRVEHYGNEKWQALWSVPGYCAAFVEGDFATADDAKAAIEARVRAALRDMGATP